MATPGKFVKLETNKLYVYNFGCVECDLTIKKDLIVDGNFELNGKLLMNKPTGLLGFWFLWPNEGGAGSKFAIYDRRNGIRYGFPSNHAIGDGDNQGKAHYNQGRDSCSLIYYYSEGGDYIASFNTTTGIITYLEISPGDTVRAPLYDKVSDRYLMFNQDSGSLMAYDPVSGAETDLTGGSGATVLNDASDSFLINDTVFFLSLSNSLGSSNQIVSFNRVSGAYNGSISWSGSHVYTGTQFKDLDSSVKFLGCGLDETNATIYFLLGSSNRRYIGYVMADSLADLEALILSGNFDINITRNTPTDPLNALAFINA